MKKYLGIIQVVAVIHEIHPETVLPEIYYTLNSGSNYVLHAYLKHQIPAQILFLRI